MKLEINERTGTCFWCGCTDRRACPEGCSWANAACTLCSSCVMAAELVRTRAGRRQLATMANADYEAFKEYARRAR